MQDKPTGADVGPATLRNDEDIRDQWSLLREVLDVNPEIRTKDELVRELTVASPEWQQRDRFERALQDLVSGGLLHIRAGDLVLPTQPAVHFDALFEAA
jgi:hypothetical protein